jgi:hypothetical protein
MQELAAFEKIFSILEEKRSFLAHSVKDLLSVTRTPTNSMNSGYIPFPQMFDRPSLLNLESAQEHASVGVKKSEACWEMTIHCIVDNTILLCTQKTIWSCRMVHCFPITLYHLVPVGC